MDAYAQVVNALTAATQYNSITSRHRVHTEVVNAPDEHCLVCMLVKLRDQLEEEEGMDQLAEQYKWDPMSSFRAYLDDPARIRAEHNALTRAAYLAAIEVAAPLKEALEEIAGWDSSLSYAREFALEVIQDYERRLEDAL